MSSMIPCPNCGRPSDGRGTYCAKCGAAIVGPPAQAPPPRSVAAPATAETGRRQRRGVVRRVVSGLALVLIGAALYWGYWEHGFERIEQLLGPAYLPASPGHGVALPQYSAPGPSIPSPIGADAGSAFERVWVEGDTIDGQGYTGLRVHAVVHAPPGSRLIFSAHFHYSDDSPVRTEDTRFRDPDLCTATSAGFVAGGGGEEVSAFLPRGAMVLELGDHSLQVLPALLDSQGQTIAVAPAVSFTARRDPDYITRVRVERAGGMFGSARHVSLKVSFYLEHALTGTKGGVVAQFEDSQGRDLVGHPPYVNAANALTAYKDFRGSTYLGVQSYDNVEVTIPASLVPEGASALVFVEDPTTRRAVTEAVHCRVP